MIVKRHSTTKPWTYADLDHYQRQIQNKILTDPGYGGELIFSEVAPVITVGKRSKLSSEKVFKVDRGGLETWHGPGQCVVFPVIRMKDYFGNERALKAATSALLEISLEVVRKYHPLARIETGERLGIWTDHGKIVSIGIAIKQGVLLHGIAINLYPVRESFAGINPCGIENAKPDFCVSEKDPEIFNCVTLCWAKSFEARFSLLEFHLEPVLESLPLYHDQDPIILSSTLI